MMHLLCLASIAVLILGQTAPALAEHPYTQTAIHHPNSALELAARLKNQGKHAEAKDVVHRLLQHHPDHQPAYFMLGLIYESEGDMTKAREAYQMYVAKNPGRVSPDPLVRIKLRQLGIF